MCARVRALLNRIELSTGVEHAGNLEALNIKHIVCVNEQVLCVSHRMFVCTDTPPRQSLAPVTRLNTSLQIFLLPYLR